MCYGDTERQEGGEWAGGRRQEGGKGGMTLRATGERQDRRGGREEKGQGK